MVAMSTVGFGDITPETEAGRLVIIGLIVCSVAALPSLVAGVLDTLRKQQGLLTKNGDRHVFHADVYIIFSGWWSFYS
jgi:voltage-gated potassium channel Kch